ncbi:hypothetical protein EGI22_05850 [Lacihabitans sp. LS3-19]|uniref:hypothetical protein n=1 Tax=Lacihabitans sp. LS3-19 TaxID=2487335 RepID=UPI0020CBE1B0|nr:hypothetical protein [Lacihabitans sp. LS3-19]MCP9767426.1 hypothetical protein [Lacihabitans sp. LS3-19]
MKKRTILTLTLTILGLSGAFAQYENNWALGLKVGEPLGLNIRKYFSYGDRSFDVNVGSFGFLYGRVRNYNKETIYDEAGIMVQGLYNFQKSIGKRERLHAYYGFGGQINSRNRTPKIGTRDAFRVISLGPAVNSGIELSIPENDLAVFIDAGGYLEIAPKPFFMAPNINLGLRLNIVK